MNTNQVALWKEKGVDFLYSKGSNLLAAAAILVLGFMLSNTIGRLLGHWLDRRGFEPPVKLLINRVVRLSIIAVALMIAVGTVGIDITPVIALMGVAGVGIGLAMQGVLGNLVCGLLIIFTKPFRVGEYIEIVGVYGQVQMIDLFTTILIHPDRSRVVVPNRKIVGEILHNYGTIRQHDIAIGVAYNSNLSHAITVIQNVLTAHPKILKDPAPVVAVNDFGESSINLAIKPWSNIPDFVATGAELKLAIAEAFRANRIEIPFPQREVRMVGATASLAS